MVSLGEFSRVVSSIYAAAITPVHWEVALRDIRRVLGSEQAGLFVDDPSWSVGNSTLPGEAAASYAQYYHRFDHVFAAVEHGLVGDIRTGTELMPLVRRSELHDWLRPLGIDDGLFVRLTDGARPVCLLTGAARGDEAFGTRDRIRLTGELVGHLQQALRAREQLAALADRTGELAAALEVIRHGVGIVAADHLMIDHNSAAERILRREDGLALRSGRITATTAHAEEKLHCALAQALGAGLCAVRRGTTLTCVRPSGRRPYIVHVLPSYRSSGEQPRRPMALVLIVDPEDKPVPPAVLLRKLYGLTRAEAEIAIRVTDGAHLKDISQELSISLPTVRTHLQHAFDKTGTHRQADLVHLLLALSP
ncbi:helix-turn-helix transcriptional regulator [Mycolicibacterium duvalii]|uniref:LuxR family transcriptional regulator n=1 Tax=Mycolicibacterium duvalii TaxID=39688 RepID=A0A7I7JWX2_9MYCO|nr:helix-turn-helix transcriptional regulator [Mycolicibacterium duvalii]MCV7370414.1 helix-turn-helix transcriptional regulator [Mycolicibacterium duvalii]PEG38153.1 helix-turn-helix transcriptional regulator [Mycolicibacterium duvalii]BBX15751.1 LuxR family transcriptional regulator [Mycolicibacterium duvalii]